MVSGNCASGFGVCCHVYTESCGSVSISTNNTYLRNPSYPATYPTASGATSCSYTINKMGPEVCQVRLDFQTLELGQTASTGACTDTLQAITSADNSVSTSYPALCGSSAGHHMYLSIGAAPTRTATITVSLASGSSTAKWNVLTRQIECNVEHMAPEGCIMYLTGVVNSWSMYGYQEGATTTENLWTQDYKVCIRRESGYCSIRHTTCSATSFDLSAQDNTDQANSFRGATDCYRDYLQIPGGSLDGNPTTFDRFCGGTLGWTPAVSTPQAIISKVVPFDLTVHTDGIETPSATPYGLCLNYQQLSC